MDLKSNKTKILLLLLLLKAINPTLEFGLERQRTGVAILILGFYLKKSVNILI